MPDITLDAEIASRRFTADAWILGDRWRHHRVRDHFGPESDLYVVLSQDIGKYALGTPIHWVIVDLVARITSLEDSDRHIGSVSMDAFIAASGTYGAGIMYADAVVFSTESATFTADASIAHGGVFTADALIVGGFTADAFIV